MSHRKFSSFILVWTVLAVLLSAETGWTADAISLVVTSTEDDIDNNLRDSKCTTDPNGLAKGACTLRAAIMEALVDFVEPDWLSATITFDRSTDNMPIILNSEISVASVANLPKGSLNIIGNWQFAKGNLTIISGNNSNRIFNIGNVVGVQLSNLQLIDGKSDKGGAILISGRSAGKVKINGCSLHNNRSQYGGALYNEGGNDVHIIASFINNNFSSPAQPNSPNYGGGAIYQEFGSITIDSSTIQNNYTRDVKVASGHGGAIYNEWGEINLRESTLYHNIAGEGRGGGIYSTGGTISISNSTISTNVAKVGGGGIYCDLNLNHPITGPISCTVYLSNDTIAFNDSLSGEGEAIPFLVETGRRPIFV